MRNYWLIAVTGQALPDGVYQRESGLFGTGKSKARAFTQYADAQYEANRLATRWPLLQFSAERRYA